MTNVPPHTCKQKDEKKMEQGRIVGAMLDEVLYEDPKQVETIVFLFRIQGEVIKHGLKIKTHVKQLQYEFTSK